MKISLYQETFDMVTSLIRRAFDVRYSTIYKKFKMNPMYKFFAIRTNEYNKENKSVDELSLIKDSFYMESYTSNAKLMVVVGYTPLLLDDDFHYINVINYLDEKYVVAFIDSYVGNDEDFAVMIYYIFKHLISTELPEPGYNIETDNTFGERNDILLLTFKCLLELDIPVDIDLLIEKTGCGISSETFKDIYKIANNDTFTINDLIYNGFLNALLKKSLQKDDES